MTVNILASGSSGNLIQIDDGKTKLLLEAGLPITKIRSLLKQRVGSNAACLLTHEHGDHSKGATALSKFIPVFATDETLQAVKGLGGYIVIPMKPFNIETYQITAFMVNHDAVDPVGYHIESKHTGEKLVYIADTSYSKFTFPDIDILIAECNYSEDRLKENMEAGIITKYLYNRIRLNHFSLENLVKFLKHCKNLSELYLVHASSKNLDFGLVSKEVGQVFKGKLYIDGVDDATNND